ncbi:unnamed protein product [Lupinus luteus]|uniref:Uncharacterized protein n=1 Tax=Lupinus luteus TaxID=3873 RepID=A0AAV1WK83_LUPLU
MNLQKSAPSVRRVVTPSWPKLDRFKLSDSRSFLDVVKGTDGVVGIPGLNSVDPSSVKDSGSFSYSAEKVDLDWLQNCMVGKTVETVDARLVSGLLKNEGFLTVAAHPIGGDLVLISPSEEKMAGAGILGRFGEDEDKVVEEREDMEREEVERRCSTSLIGNNSPVRFSHEAPFIGINDECGADLNNGITGINDECVPVLNNENDLALIEEIENFENPLNVLEYVVKAGGTCAYEGNNESFSNSIIDGGPELNEKEYGLHGVVAPSILAAPLFQNNLDSLEFNHKSTHVVFQMLIIVPRLQH